MQSKAHTDCHTVSKGRDTQAIAVLTKYHCGGNSDDPLIQYEYEEIKAALAIEAEAAQVSWLSLFKSRGNLRVGSLVVSLGQSTDRRSE